MSWFKFGDKNERPKDSDNGILGFTHLDQFTEVVKNPGNLKKFEWRRSLKSSTGNNKFKIKYYGDLHDTYDSLIVETDFAPAKMVAIDILTKEEILLFDGCKHGYDAITWVEFSKEQIENRILDKIYKDKRECETFEIELSAYYKFDFESELEEDIDESGEVELNDGSKIKFEELKRNACDYLCITAINEYGNRVEIFSQELA